VTTKGFLPPSRHIAGSVVVPGSKSLSNRALVCAALGDGESQILGVASGDDTGRMIAAITQLGAKVEGGSGSLVIRGPINTADTAPLILDAGLAGTTSRFLTAVAALRRGETTITGGPGLRARPMGELHRLVRELGATVKCDREGCLPVTVRGVDLATESPTAGSPRLLTARGDTSSQFISAVMMVAPWLGGAHIRLEGIVVSREYLQMTAQVMQHFGVAAKVDSNDVLVPQGRYRASRFVAEADWSSASYVFGAAAIVGGSVRVPLLRRDTTQPESRFLEVLEAVGCHVRLVEGEGGVEVSRKENDVLRGASVDMSSMSDLVPTLAAIAACASSPTEIRGVGFIRTKESDRLGDLAHELSRCGVGATVFEDGIRIEPRPLKSSDIDPHDDHRLAMALSLLGLRHEGISVRDASVVEKSWPAFWQDMSSGLNLGVVG
jgi:3-phosphoshikimate 1-carboxyvinyltransferase